MPPTPSIPDASLHARYVRALEHRHAGAHAAIAASLEPLTAANRQGYADGLRDALEIFCRVSSDLAAGVPGRSSQWSLWRFSRRQWHKVAGPTDTPFAVAVPPGLCRWFKAGVRPQVALGRHLASSTCSVSKLETRNSKLAGAA